MNSILWTNEEVMNLLYAGLVSELFASSGGEVTKKEIFREAEELMEGVTPELAGGLCGLKVSYPHLSLVELVRERG